MLRNPFQTRPFTLVALASRASGARVLHRVSITKKCLSYLLLMGGVLFAQTTGIAASVSQKADSLRGVFVSATSDTGKVAALTELSYLFRNSWPDSTLMYADRAIRFCETKNLPALFPQWAGYANAIGNKAIGYRLKGEYLRAQEYYFRALAMDCKLGNASGKGKRFVGISQMYLNTGNNPKALEYAYKALAQSKTNKNKTIIIL